MRKTAASIALALFVCNPLMYGATYELAGQVTNGASLFPHIGSTIGVEFNEFGLPIGGYPVDYTARLVIDSGQQDWVFEFAVTDDERTVEHQILGTLTDGSSRQFDRNEVAVSPEQIVMDFHRVDILSVDFNIDIDLQAGTGAWEYRQDCPVCDLAVALPSATATVSSVRLIPEPSSICAAMIGVLGLLASRR